MTFSTLLERVGATSFSEGYSRVISGNLGFRVTSFSEGYWPDPIPPSELRSRPSEKRSATSTPLTPLGTAAGEKAYAVKQSNN